MGTDGRETDVVNLGELLKIQVRMSDEGDCLSEFKRNLIFVFKFERVKA